MTAASAYPPGSEQGLAEGRLSEPSMEDILASIRRIIADDQQTNGARRRTPPVAAETALVPTESAPDRDDVLDLARFVPAGETANEPADHTAPERHEPTIEAHPQPVDHPAGPAVDVETQLPEPAAHQAEPPEYYAAFDAYDAEGETRDASLLAPQMSESVMSAFEALAATVVLENKPMLERILRDLLRPMLKTWLDDNLPVLVERLVRTEIERVARGGRG